MQVAGGLEDSWRVFKCSNIFHEIKIHNIVPSLAMNNLSSSRLTWSTAGIIKAGWTFVDTFPPSLKWYFNKIHQYWTDLNQPLLHTFTFYIFFAFFLSLLSGQSPTYYIPFSLSSERKYVFISL